MNRGTFLTTLTGGGLALPHFVAAAETPDEKSIYDALDAVIDAQFSSNFPRLASLLHPSSLGLFRNFLSARFDVLTRSYTMESISAITELSGHPKDLKLSDAEFFATACESAKVRHPEFVGDLKFLPLTVHGTIFERDLGFVLFSLRTPCTPSGPTLAMPCPRSSHLIASGTLAAALVPARTPDRRELVARPFQTERRSTRTEITS